MKAHVSFRVVENIQRVVDDHDICYSNNLFESSVAIRVKKKSHVTKELIERLVRKHLVARRLPERITVAKIVVTFIWYEDEQ